MSNKNLNDRIPEDKDNVSRWISLKGIICKLRNKLRLNNSPDNKILRKEIDGLIDENKKINKQLFDFFKISDRIDNHITAKVEKMLDKQNDLFLQLDTKINILTNLKDNSVDISRIKKDIEMFNFAISENDKKAKFYVDSNMLVIKDSIDKINSTLSSLKEYFADKTGKFSSNIYEIKNELTAINGKIHFEDNKIELLNREIPGLRESLKKNSSAIDLFDSKLNRFNSELELLSKSIQYEVNNEVNKKISAYQKWINDEFYEITKKIIVIVKDLLINKKSSINEIDKLGESLRKNALEEKWRKDNEDKGIKILNKGALIIEKLEEIKNKIIDDEKQGLNVDDLKQQRKAYEDIMEMIK